MSCVHSCGRVGVGVESGVVVVPAAVEATLVDLEGQAEV
jgi:hypothetical protein